MLLDSFCVPLQSHDTVHNNVLTTVDVCDASAKTTCTRAKKEECSEGVNSKDCGNCLTGFKQDSEVSTSCVDICDTAAIMVCSSVHREACSPGSDDCGGCSVNYESYDGMPCELVGGNNGGMFGNNGGMDGGNNGGMDDGMGGNNGGMDDGMGGNNGGMDDGMFGNNGGMDGGNNGGMDIRL